MPIFKEFWFQCPSLIWSHSQIADAGSEGVQRAKGSFKANEGDLSSNFGSKISNMYVILNTKSYKIQGGWGRSENICSSKALEYH